MYNYYPDKTNELDQFFKPMDIKRHPTFMRCKMTRENFNKPINEYTDPFDVKINGKDDCVETIHPGGPTRFRQKGFSKNVDIDSELKRINHYADKCYYNNYKLDPMGSDAKLMKSPLQCHDNIFKINETQSYKKSEQGSLLDRNNLPKPCIKMDKFNLCKNTPMTGRQLELYDFGQPNYCAQYPCQKLFNNTTKRKMYLSSHTPQDLNKITSNVDYTNLIKQNGNHQNIDKFFSEDLMCMPYSMTNERGTHPDECKSTPVKLRYY
jgi:hypothetical protein